MIIVGISGKKLSGKTTVARMLVGELHLKSVIHGFADALKREVINAIHSIDLGTVDAKDLVDAAFIEKHKADFRLILQGWGTDFRRKHCGENYWIRKLDAEIAKYVKDKVELIVVPDVRFQNEADYIRSIPDSVLIRIERSVGPSNDVHLSETELTKDNYDYDHIIYNYSDLANLMKEVKYVIEHFLNSNKI